MDCLHKINPLAETSIPTSEIEQNEKVIIKKIQMLVNPILFPDLSRASSLVKDPFEEAINLAKILTAARKESALIYIAGQFPATDSDRAYQTLDLIETQEKRNQAVEKIQITQFRALLKQGEFASARRMIAKLPAEELYYHRLYVVKSLEYVQFDEALKIVKNAHLIEEAFDFVKNIPENFNDSTYLSQMLNEICDKFLLIGHLDKALLAVRMIKNNDKMRDKQLQEIGKAYLKLDKFESVYALLSEIKSSFYAQCLKENLCYAHFKRGETIEGLMLIKEFDDELIWPDLRMNLESLIEDYKNKGQQQLAAQIQQGLETQEKILQMKN